MRQSEAWVRAILGINVVLETSYNFLNTPMRVNEKDSNDKNLFKRL